MRKVGVRGVKGGKGVGDGVGVGGRGAVVVRAKGNDKVCFVFGV